jgi:hypothetical protein
MPCDSTDHVRFHANAHVLRALHQKRLVDQVPQQVFLLFLVDLVHLFGGAALAVVDDLFVHGLFGLLDI